MTTETKPASKNTAARRNASPLEEQLRAVAEQIKQQQAQIERQQAQIRELQQSNTQLQDQLQQQQQMLEGSVQQATKQAAAAQESVNDLHSSVTDLQTESKAAATAFANSKKAVDALENPVSIHFKGVTITPGGWVESTFLARSRNENADITSNFNAVPFNGVSNANLSEFRGSARGSRPIVVVTSSVGSTKLTGYFEMDFLGQSPTSNQVQTNSFTPRQRQLWMQAEFKNGITLTAGQMWSLLTTDRKGIATRAEFIPTTLEGSYVVGYTYSRQTSVRFNKNFSNKLWAAFEIANSETTVSSSFTPANLMGFNNSANALSPNGSTLNFLAGSTNGFSTNIAPDLIGKVAFEPGYGHYEIKAVARIFRDRVGATATVPGNTNVTAGGGLGWGVVLPIKEKKADFIFEGMAGKGIGRYGAANTPDVTLRPDGAILPLPTIRELAGVEVHPYHKLDLFFYGGDEYVGAIRYTTVTAGLPAPAGYGSPLVNNTNCTVEVVPSGGAACGALNKNIYDLTGGFWFRIYKGPFGTFQYGSQLAYIHRTAWSGIGGAPTGSDIMGLTGLRLYLP